MRNRFETKKIQINTRVAGFLPLLLFFIILGGFLVGIHSVSNTTSEKQLESLKTTISRSIAHCYAVEGMYPPDLDYLKEHYGLVYDEAAYLVDYQPIGSNIAPEVTVLPRTENNHEWNSLETRNSYAY